MFWKVDTKCTMHYMQDRQPKKDSIGAGCIVYADVLEE